jgi:Tol biopolymer transport system component
MDQARRVGSLALLLAASSAFAGTPRELAYRDGANLQRPNFSPDGLKLSWEANYHEKKSIETWVGDPRTGSFSKIVPQLRSASSVTQGFSQAGQKGGQVVYELAWAPASMPGRYVYTASNDVLDYDLYLGGGGPIAAGLGADGGAAFSPDGKYLAFTSARTGQGDIYSLALARVADPPVRLSTDPDASELMISWTPDSRSVVFVGHSEKGDNLYVLSAIDGSATPKRLLDWTGSQVRPTISPSGGQVAFYANKEDPARFDLYVADLAGGTPKKLLTDAVMNAAGPVWSPDGKSIISVQDDDSRLDPIVVIPIADASKVKILDFGTVGNGDIDVVKTADGKIWAAWVAQGTTTEKQRGFDKLFTAELTGLLP